MLFRSFWASSGSREGEFVQAPAPFRPRTGFWDTHANARRCSHSTPNQTCFPFPALPGWRSVGGPFGPKWAWHSRGVHIFKKLVFSIFLKIHAIRRVLRSSGGFWPSPGTPQTDQGHDHFEASFRSCFAGAGGHPVEHQAANHYVNLCRMPSLRQACVHEPS